MSSIENQQELKESLKYLERVYLRFFSLDKINKNLFSLIESFRSDQNMLKPQLDMTELKPTVINLTCIRELFESIDHFHKEQVRKARPEELKQSFEKQQTQFYKFISLINTQSDMVINPDRNNLQVVMKQVEVHRSLYAWMSEQVHSRLKEVEEDELDQMPEAQLQELESIKIHIFVDRFYDEIHTQMPFPVNRIPEAEFKKWFTARLNKMYEVIDKEALDELFEFIKSGEVFSLATQDEILTYELKHENDMLKERLKNVKDLGYKDDFKLNPVLGSNGNEISKDKQNNSNNRNKYEEMDTSFKTKELHKGLTGLNTGFKKKESTIISKKALDEQNNNLRAENIDGTSKKSKQIAKSNKNFFEENKMKIKAKEWENKEKEYQDHIKKLEENTKKSKKSNIEQILCSTNRNTMSFISEKESNADKVERIIKSTQGFIQSFDKDVKKDKKRATTPIRDPASNLSDQKRKANLQLFHPSTQHLRDEDSDEDDYMQKFKEGLDDDYDNFNQHEIEVNQSWQDNDKRSSLSKTSFRDRLREDFSHNNTKATKIAQFKV